MSRFFSFFHPFLSSVNTSTRADVIDISTESPARIPWHCIFPLFCFFAFAILLFTWPWAQTFSSHVFQHWDPAFHAWKLEFAARELLAGRILPAEGNTNLYYPYSGAFYFEALHWPQAVFAAVLLQFFTSNVVLVYHITMVTFWALSGVCFWLLLITLRRSSLTAFIGACCFVLMPYRMSYRVEFNMQLCFAIPLFYCFLVRFFQHPSVSHAFGMAFALWLQATSELYQAVFLLLTLPFPVLTLLRGRYQLLRSGSHFWRPLVIACLGILPLVYYWLWPYYTTLSSQTLVRSLNEIRSHVLEPLSYFTPGHFLGSLPIHQDELSPYPTLWVLLFAGLYTFHEIFLSHTSLSSRQTKLQTALRYACVGSLTLFIGFALFCHGVGPLPTILRPIYSHTPLLSVLLVGTLAFIGPPHNTAKALTNGLLAGAVFAYFMSLGPECQSFHQQFHVYNSLFVRLYQYLPALHGFRVVSRFAFFVLFALIVAATSTLDTIRTLSNLRLRHLALAITSLLLVVFCFESIPPHEKLKVKPLQSQVISPVLETFDALPQPTCLAILPLGYREIDSRQMLELYGTRRLGVYAWGGAYPPLTQQIKTAFTSFSPEATAQGLDVLRQLWPTPQILLDYQALNSLRMCPFDLATVEAQTTLLAADTSLSLRSLSENLTPQNTHSRWVRYDILLAHPSLHFTLQSTDSTSVCVSLNDHVLESIDLPMQSTHTFTIPLNPTHFLRHQPNHFQFISQTPFTLTHFTLMPLNP